jgi:hypothetical protein
MKTEYVMKDIFYTDEQALDWFLGVLTDQNYEPHWEVHGLYEDILDLEVRFLFGNGIAKGTWVCSSKIEDIRRILKENSNIREIFLRELDRDVKDTEDGYDGYNIRTFCFLKHEYCEKLRELYCNSLVETAAD